MSVIHNVVLWNNQAYSSRIPSQLSRDVNSPYSIRFLFVSLIPDSRQSGMGKWTYSIVNALLARGHTAELWFGDQFPGWCQRGKLSIVVGPMALAQRLVAARHRFDVAIVHEPFGLCYGVLRKCFPGLPPLVVMCHNVESHVSKTLEYCATKGFTEMTIINHVSQQFLRRPFSDGAITLADQIICLSSTDRSYLTRDLRRKSDRVCLMINGVGPEYRQVVNPSVREPNVLFVGGWLDIKGRRLLPCIWRRIRQRIPGAQLTLVGTGRNRDHICLDFAESDRGSLQVLNGLDDEGMARLYRTHAVFLMPSLSEGSPLSIAEALAVGIPIVAARVGGISDMVRDREQALLFPLGDVDTAAEAVCEVLDDPELADRLRSNGRIRAQELTWDSAAAVLECTAQKAMGIL